MFKLHNLSDMFAAIEKHRQRGTVIYLSPEDLVSLDAHPDEMVKRLEDGRQSLWGAVLIGCPAIRPGYCIVTGDETPVEALENAHGVGF